MAKISNEIVYIPNTEIEGLDYFIGTDFSDGKRTVNFRIQDLGSHYNTANGVRNLDYFFYNHISANPRPTDGYFYSNGNEQDPNNITHFIFSKKTMSKINAIQFFDSITAINPFDLIISQKVGINSIYFFRIDSVQKISDYFKLNVSKIFYPENNSLEYTDSFAVFNIKASGISVTKTSDLINDGEDSTSTYVETDDLGSVAFSNDYEDLDNKPTIPSPITNHSGLSLDDGTNPHGTTKGDVGLSNVPNLNTTNAVNNEHTHSNKTILDNTTESFITALKNAYDGAVSWITTNGTNLINHLSNISNPHNVTKSQVGLGNVPNVDTSTTSNVSEGSNLYFTTARVLGTVLSGLSLATGVAIVSTDSILVAFGKIQNQINNLVTLNTTQTITGNKQFNDVGLIKKVNTSTYPTTSGGSFYIGGNGDYDVFKFYSIDGNDSDSFGVSQIYSSPEDGNQITHTSLDNQKSSSLRLNYDETYIRHIFGGQRTSLYVNGITDKIIIEGTQSKYAALGTSLITGTKNFEFPDKNGTLALLSDIIESAENKVDKVTTSGVERAYIINADGSQSTKATSELKDVLEFADFASFPVTGESEKIYIDLVTNFTYRWSGSAYVQIGGGSGLTFQEVLRMKTILNSL